MTKEEQDELYARSAELSSLKQTLSESSLSKYFPNKEMSFHDSVILAIANMDYLIENQPEFAKQKAIAFDKWKLANYWLWDTSILKYFKWDNDYNKRQIRFSHEEIYDQFIEQQNKDNA